MAGVGQFLGARQDAPSYRWELTAPGYPAERCRFELMAEPDATRLRDSLAVFDREAKEYPRGTLTIMRVSLLFEEGLYQEARRELETALAADRDQPTLQFMLGHVYDRIGLPAHAAQAFERARLRTAGP
jgi:uncharacterized protein HemY